MIVKDSAGEVHEFPNAGSYQYAQPHGTTTVRITSQADGQGEFLALFINPIYVKPSPGQAMENSNASYQRT